MMPRVPASKVHQLPVQGATEKGREQKKADLALRPVVRTALVAGAWTAPAFSGEQPGLRESVTTLEATVEQAKGGDLNGQVEMLVAQATTLDAMFTELSRRALVNLSQYPDAAEAYLRLALKAQGNARTTIEALAKITRGGEQVVRHIHVDNRGGQAIIGETINQGGQNAQLDEPPHAQGTSSPPLLGSDPPRHAMPMPGDRGTGTVPDARRQELRRSSGQ